MGNKMLIILQICWTMTPIWAAFKDFVIESEKDLQRFGMDNEDTYYEDDVNNLEFYSEYQTDYDYFVDDSCGSYSNMMTDPHIQFDNDVNVEGNGGTIDGRILKELLHKLAKDPRFRQLGIHSLEDYSVLGYENNFDSVIADNPISYEKFYQYDDLGNCNENF